VKPAQVRELFERLQSLNPHPVTELEHATPFELLLAVILSAQATDKSVNIATRKLFPVANTPEQILALGTDGLTSCVRTIGLYPGKVKNILATCRLLIERHGGAVPADREALEELPGVGRKTANVVLNSAFGRPTMPVDTHIFRVANRLGLAHGDTPRAVEDGLLRAIPAEYLLNAHHWLLLHGRYVCKARKPACPRCPLVDLCACKDKALPLPTILPLVTPKKPSRAASGRH
jgi:endonuclease-3